jgi:nucleoside kinase
MKIAVLGPITKDYVTIDGKTKLQIGGIPYYVALALKNLGEEVIPYITFKKEDEKWVRENFNGLEIYPIYSKGTLESYIEYESANPDFRKAYIENYLNVIKPEDKLISELQNFNYIILAPLFHDNIPFELFEKLKNKNLILGNFGMFTYNENGKFIRKNPENLIRVLPFIKYLFLDNIEAAFVSGKNSIEESAKSLLEQGLPNLIITEGSKGSHVFVGGKYYKIPAFPPKKLVDTTGAGDTYMAAFIKALELFSNPQKQGEFAAMVATISLEKSGAFDGNLEEVLEGLKIINKK